MEVGAVRVRVRVGMRQPSRQPERETARESFYDASTCSRAREHVGARVVESVPKPKAASRPTAGFAVRGAGLGTDATTRGLRRSIVQLTFPCDPGRLEVAVGHAVPMPFPQVCFLRHTATADPRHARGDDGGDDGGGDGGEGGDDFFGAGTSHLLACSSTALRAVTWPACQCHDGGTVCT